MILFILIPLPGFLNDCSLPLLGSILPSLAWHHPLLYLSISLGLKVFLAFLVDVEEGHCIRNKILLNVLVKGSVCSEAGRVVDLQQIWVELVVEHDVKPQYLEAHVVGEVVGVDWGDWIAQGGVTSDYRFDEDVVDLALELIDIVALLCDLLEHRGKGSLVANVHVWIR